MGDNERMCVIKTRLRLKISTHMVGLNPGPLDQRASVKSTELPELPHFCLRLSFGDPAITPNAFLFKTKILLMGQMGRTVQTQIRLLQKEQSDQGLHCLPFPLQLLVAFRGYF